MSDPHPTLRPDMPADAAIPFTRPTTPQVSPPRIGFCGIGAMGKLMARNLARNQPPDAAPVLIYNRTSSKARELADELGAQKIRVASSPEQIVAECDVIFTSLPNDFVVKSLYQRFAGALKDSRHQRRKIFVETSTIYPTLAGELDALVTGAHTFFITAPVFGAPPAADTAQLVIAMSGETRAKRDVAYMMVPHVGRKVIDLGSNVEKGPTLKIIGNSLVLGSIELIGECMTLAMKAEIGSQQVKDIIQDLFPSPPWLLYSDKIQNDKFDGTTGFNIEGGLKDASHIRSLSAKHNSPMPIIDIAHQHMLTARALHGLEHNKAKYPILDWSATASASRAAAGLDPFDSTKDVNTMEGIKAMRVKD